MVVAHRHRHQRLQSLTQTHVVGKNTVRSDAPVNTHTHTHTTRQQTVGLNNKTTREEKHQHKEHPLGAAAVHLLVQEPHLRTNIIVLYLGKV